jgi:hypothetical protein
MSPQYTLDRWLSGLQSPSGRYAQTEISGIKLRLFYCPVCGLVTVPAELTRHNTARIYALSFLYNCFASYIWRIPYNLLLKCQKCINFWISEVMPWNLVEYYKVLEHPDASTARAVLRHSSGTLVTVSEITVNHSRENPPPPPTNNDLSGERRQEVSSAMFRNSEQIRTTTFNGWHLGRNVDEINVTYTSTFWS